LGRIVVAATAFAALPAHADGAWAGEGVVAPAQAATPVADPASPAAPSQAAAAAYATHATGGHILVLLAMPPPHLRVGRDYAGSYGDGPGLAARRRQAASIARRAGLVLTEDWPMPLIGVDCFVMSVPAERSTLGASTEVAAMAGVAWAQPVRQFLAQSAAGARTDPLFQAQPAAVSWHLADLHRLADGRGVRIAVIDSEIDARHPDLRGQLDVQLDFAPQPARRPERHGTAVAAIIAAVSGNGVGIVGVAPRARLLGLRACWEQSAQTTVCDSLSLAKALHAAVDRGAKVVNMSLGGPRDLLLERLLGAALNRGVTVVAATDPGRVGGGFPASHAGVIAVSDSASGRPAERAYVAPGRGVPTATGKGGWGIVSGSSYAAAHVSGLMALVRSRSPPVRPPIRLATLGPERQVIDSCATLAPAGAGCVCGCGPASGMPESPR
jgi:subtilisin family serine protease